MEVSPALGINLKDYSSKDILTNKKWRISEKIDGVRRLFFKFHDGTVRCYTRSGKADLWLTHITKRLEDARFPSNYVYDTELVDSGSYFLEEESYVIRNTTAAKASQQFIKNKTDLMAICFDIFKPDGDLTKGEDRDKLLKTIFSSVPKTWPIQMVTTYGTLVGNDLKTLRSLMNKMTARKKEGLMLMNLDTPYIPGRSKELIKVKRIEEFIGRVIDIELAGPETKIVGGISALICDVNGCTVPVRVGSGFTDEERKIFAKDPPIGRLIEIEAFSMTKSGNGHISLSMPIFKRIVVLNI